MYSCVVSAWVVAPVAADEGRTFLVGVSAPLRAAGDLVALVAFDSWDSFETSGLMDLLVASAGPSVVQLAGLSAPLIG